LFDPSFRLVSGFLPSLFHRNFQLVSWLFAACGKRFRLLMRGSVKLEKLSARAISDV